MTLDFNEAFDQEWTGPKPPPNGAAGQEKPDQSGPRPFNLLDCGAERFTGNPPPIRWLVENSIPLGVPALLAAMGGVGKSFSALNLCRLVSMQPAVGNLSFNVPVFGGQVVEHGVAVFLTAEDSENSLWRRVQALDPLNTRQLNPRRLLVKSICGEYPRRVFFMQDNRLGLWATEDWKQFCKECIAIEDLKLIVIDPLQMFAQVALDNDNAAAQFVCTQLAWLAEKTGATVLACHHMSKGPGTAPTTPAEARHRVRGSSGLVDGVRCAYAFWAPDEAEGKKTCKDLCIPYSPKRVVKGAVIKTNEPENEEVAIHVRSETGLLVDRTADIRARRPDQKTVEEALIEAVRDAAVSNHPFSQTGEGGLYAHRERLPDPLCTWGRDRLEVLCRDLIKQKRLVRCMAEGSKVGKWLDVPDGPFTRGAGQFEHGAVDV